MNNKMEDLFLQLSDAEKQELKALLLDDLEPVAENVATDYPVECPHCQHQDIVRNGSINKTPRFKCKACGKTFSFSTYRLRYRSQKSRAFWSLYIDLMFQGLSVRKLRYQMRLHGMNICQNTAFYWRHKILALLLQAIRTNLSGVVEADETFFPLSFKGKKGPNRKATDLGRRPHKRGEAASQRGISKEQVCVSTAVARSGGSYMKSVCLGRMSINDFHLNLAQHINWSKTTLMTDGHNAYVPPSSATNALHVRVHHFGRGAKHINTVNSAHSHLKQFMKRFNGVATKYLDNYLVWFQWRKRNYREPLKTYRGFIEWDALRDMEMTLT